MYTRTTTSHQESSKHKNHHFSFLNTNNLNQQNYQTSGLARYRSAPSSFFANMMSDSGSDFGNVSVSHEMNTTDGLKSVMELDHQSNLGGYYNSASPVYHDSNNNHHTDSFVLPRGIKLENCNSGNFVKQNNLLQSVQSGVFSNSAVESGFSAAREVGNFNSFNGTTNGDEANRSTSPLENQINFSSEPYSSKSKVGNGTLGITSFEDGKLQNAHSDQDSYVPNFTMDYWDEPAVTGLKRTRDGNAKMFSATQTQNWDERGHTSGLARHMSLPNSSTEMAAVAKFMHSQDSTPCKIRAKRGFATHPRSIAERVRRTRISERIRKLQELFPDMDKQTNTADMLEMAVDYIKKLQKQVDVLTDTKSSCTCSSKQQQFSHLTA